MLEEKLRDKTARIGVVGLGYVGLPLALAFSEAGFKVLGFDIQQSKVDLINRKKSYIGDVSDARLSKAVDEKRLEATTEQGYLNDADATCICVPTFLTKARQPDLSSVVHASEEIARHLRPQQLVVLESTTYPGTTREVVLPILERSGLKVGLDFYLAYSPERVDPGNKTYGINNVPKIVGGIDGQCTELALLLYSHVAEKLVPVSSPDVAEMTKVFENVFRNVNIALVNELAQLCEKMGTSVWEVIDTASTKPFGYMPFYPGPGVGGHCIPLDPYYLAANAREYDTHTRFIEIATEINEYMPYHVVSSVIAALNSRGKSVKDAKVFILGVAYKKNVGDVRESPCIKLIELLRERGANVSYNDPLVPVIRLSQHTMTSVELSDDGLFSADCVVIGTDHSVYDLERIASHSRLLFDTRGATKKWKRANVVMLGR